MRPSERLVRPVAWARQALRSQIDRAERRREERRRVVLHLEPGTVIGTAPAAATAAAGATGGLTAEAAAAVVGAPAPTASAAPAPPSPSSEAVRPSALDGLPGWLVRGGLGSWLLLGLVIIVSLAVFATSKIVEVFVGVFVALVVTSLLQPVVTFLARFMPRFLATFLALLGSAGLVAGLLTYVVASVTSQWSTLAEQFYEGVSTILDFLENGPLPLHLTEQQVTEQFEEWLAVGQEYVESNAPSLASEVLSNAGTVVVFFTVLALAVFCTIFFLASGGRMWRWFIDELPSSMRLRVHRAAGAGWYTFAGYARGTVIVAFADAVMAGVFLQVVGIPMAAPLAVLVFIGAFIPIVGAPAAMVTAMIVALASHGLLMSVVVGLGVAGIGQIEGHVLQPLIMGRQVSLHPVVVIIVVAVGTFAAGLLGAIIAVPVVSVIWSVYSELHTKDRPVQGDLPRYEPAK